MPERKTKSQKASPKTKNRKKSMRLQYHKLFTCKKCFEEFGSRKAWHDHKTNCHIGDDNKMYKYNEITGCFTCNSCNGDFKSQQEIEEHINRIHQEMYTCDLCKHISYNAFQYAVHMKTHNTDSENIQCPLCSYNTPQRKCMQNHINSVHYRKFNYRCSTCNKGFNDPVLFKEHYNAHLGIKSFVCIVCNKQFMFSRYLTVHQTRYHTVHINGCQYANKCSFCPKIFSKAETLAKHIDNKHTNNKDKIKEHLCDICGNSFRTTNKLKIHYRIHTGDKPYTCSYCGKAFSKRDYLVMHERVHTGEKPYSCEYCGKCFNQSASHRIHVRGHTGERPYKCHLCNGGYISRGSLNLHLKMCTGFKNE